MMARYVHSGRSGWTSHDCDGGRDMVVIAGVGRCSLEPIFLSPAWQVRSRNFSRPRIILWCRKYRL